jgi:7-keto-8-aminopelargonate synthetase-like enzyme
VAASIAVFDLLSSSSALRDKLQENADYFRRQMAAAGFSIRPGSHPIVVRNLLCCCWLLTNLLVQNLPD